MPQLLDLPQEIGVRVLSFLDLADLASASTTHSSLYAAFKSSPGLEYRFAAYAAGVEANVHSNHVASERLSALESLEKGWSNLTFDFRKKIPVKHSISGLYDFTEGICFLGDAKGDTLHYLNMPSKPDDPVAWSKIEIGRQMVDFGLAIHEHDLIAVLTVTPHSTHLARFVVEVRLSQFSTGEPHRLAQTPILFVYETSIPRPAISIDIFSDHLVLFVSYAARHFLVRDDRMYVFHWKTGILKMKGKFPCQSYHGAISLSPTILCLPNARTNTLDIWPIPSEPIDYSDGRTPTNPFMKLTLPAIARTHAIIATRCRAEPNPTPGGTPYSSRPSHTISGDAIVIINFRIVHRLLGTIDSLVMYVHRHELLRICMDLRPDHTPHTLLMQSPVIVPWGVWGPQRTRWFDVAESSSSSSWITTTAGQRCVIASKAEEGSQQTVTVLDFNPRTLRRLSKEGSRDNGLRKVVEEDSVVGAGIFEEPIRSALPYVSVVRPLESDSSVAFRTVVLDEERLLGISVGTKDIEVLHVGVSRAGEAINAWLGILRGIPHNLNLYVSRISFFRLKLNTFTGSTYAMAFNSRGLPQEVYDFIVDELADLRADESDIKDLRNCSLVSLAFRNRSQSRLLGILKIEASFHEADIAKNASIACWKQTHALRRMFEAV
ncbi:hypothetical protein DXG01_005752 [Tephrocybe rancida]|nr:hypothetical protein DXG01_005752 [Tephrocybe rancida]